MSLNLVMNCPGLTPLAPSTGPSGGAGVALPPGAMILKTFVIFLAIESYLLRSVLQQEANLISQTKLFTT
jgi:hypothetical protein